MKMQSIYIINPKADFPTYFGADAYSQRGYSPTTLIADLAVTTLAGFVPPHFHVDICDENVSPIDFGSSAEIIGITGKVTQRGRMRSISQEFRRRGKTVMMGGPYASLSPEDLRPHCDILVRGEVEDLADELFTDISGGRGSDEYVGGMPDLIRSPLPRWDLYPNERAIIGSVQTSRGCPFDCEFCDVIQYLGRKQRHKSSPQIFRELDELYKYGYRHVFLADDNFTIHRHRTKELLAELRDWNDRQADGRVDFETQVSIDAAKDDELLEMCFRAGMKHVFVGIETPNADSLREARKRQNLNVDLGAQVQRFFDRGISVTGGMIVGFDSDGPDIFERQYEFAMSTAIPVFTVGALTAPAATPLHKRLAAEGRLVTDGTEVAAVPWNTNIIPCQLSRDQLLDGTRWLCSKLYHPAAFGERVLRLIKTMGPKYDAPCDNRMRHPGRFREIEGDSMGLLAGLARMGPDESKMWSRVTQALSRRPELGGTVMQFLLQYIQIRHIYKINNIMP